MIHLCARNEDVRAFTAVAVHRIQPTIYHFISLEVHCDDANNSGHNDIPYIIYVPIITFTWYTHLLDEEVYDVRMCYLLVVISVFSDMNIHESHPNSKHYQCAQVRTTNQIPNFICNNLIKVSNPIALTVSISKIDWQWKTRKVNTLYSLLRGIHYPNAYDKNQHDAG